MENGTNYQLNELTDLYHSFQDSVSVIPAPEDGSLKSLVPSIALKSTPIHGWYIFKEGYSHELLDTLQKEILLKNL